MGDVSLFDRLRSTTRDLRDRLLGEPEQTGAQVTQTGEWEHDSAGEKQARMLIARNADGTYQVGQQQRPIEQEPAEPVWDKQRFGTLGEAEQHADLAQHNWLITRERETDIRADDALDFEDRGKQLIDTNTRDRWERSVDIVNGSTLTDEDKKRAIGELGQAPPITVSEERDGLSVDGRQLARFDRQAEIAIEDTAPDKGIGFSQDLPEHERTQDQNASLGLEL